jgi:hypothetical protein
MDQWAVGIRLLVGMLMVLPMDSDPPRGCVLQTADAQGRQTVFQPSAALEATVRQQSVIANGHAQHAEEEMASNRQDDASPAEQPW